jgi:dephospho-CoA kinase
MIIVGLTGGIGSGKTTVAKMFYKIGVPVYIADLEAKALMNRSKVIKRKLIALFGTKAYKNNIINRPYLASQIFKNKELLEEMNAIVHPKVASHFKRWLKKQNAEYIIKEVAILFENGSYVYCDKIITVVASAENRIERVIIRDNSSKDKIEAIMNNQWTDDKRIALSDFVIYNDDLVETKKQVKEIHQKILLDQQ